VVHTAASFNLYAQETLSGVQRQIDRVDKEIAREKKLHKQDKEKAAAFGQQKEQKKKTLDGQLVKMAEKSRELAQKIQTLRKQKEALQKGVLQYKERRREVLVELDETVNTLLPYFQRDFPHQRDKKIQDLQGFKEDLKRNNLVAEEALNRFFSFLSQAIDQGYESEVFSGTYTSTQGKFYDGHYLRLGSVVYVFVSLDDKHVAYLLRDPNAQQYYWVDQDLPLELRQQIKLAIQVAQGKAAPALASLPFSVWKDNGSTYRSESGLSQEDAP
jgi:vacuolar-type H+-ATPase subunit I/STV1